MICPFPGQKSNGPPTEPLQQKAPAPDDQGQHTPNPAGMQTPQAPTYQGESPQPQGRVPPPHDLAATTHQRNQSSRSPLPLKREMGTHWREIPVTPTMQHAARAVGGGGGRKTREPINSHNHTHTHSQHLQTCPPTPATNTHKGNKRKINSTGHANLLYRERCCREPLMGVVIPHVRSMSYINQQLFHLVMVGYLISDGCLVKDLTNLRWSHNSSTQVEQDSVVVVAENVSDKHLERWQQHWSKRSSKNAEHRNPPLVLSEVSVLRPSDAGLFCLIIQFLDQYYSLDLASVFTDVFLLFRI